MQAPDVILIGEIRDRETMEHAITFAETGHLCMGTLHANSSNQALDRVINFFPEERRAQLLMDLSLNLKGFISQRLIPKREGKGRAAAIEILLNSPLIADLIFKGEVGEIKEIMKKSRELGMQTFDQALFDAFEANLISYEDALRFEQVHIETYRRLGYDLVYPAPYGLVGPKGMDPAVLKTLHDAFKKAMDDPKHLELIEQLNQDLWYRSGEDYAKWAVETFARDKALIERLGLAAK